METFKEFTNKELKKAVSLVEESISHWDAANYVKNFGYVDKNRFCCDSNNCPLCIYYKYSNEKEGTMNSSCSNCPLCVQEGRTCFNRSDIAKERGAWYAVQILGKPKQILLGALRRTLHSLNVEMYVRRNAPLFEKTSKYKTPCKVRRSNIYTEIADERKSQDKQWGGANHDCKHTANDWAAYIIKHTGRVVTNSSTADLTTFRIQMLKVAALAVAAIESCDRHRRILERKKD